MSSRDHDGPHKIIAVAEKVQPRRRWLTWLGVAVDLALLGFLAWRLDWRQFAEAMRSARPEYVLATFLALTLEQLVRAWKWRQILIPLRKTLTLHLFGATMAGYLANLLVPVGVSPFVRSWLIARRQKLSMSSVLATVAIDRLVDGLVFAGIVVLVVLAATIPDPNGNIARGLLLGAGGTAVAIGIVFVLFARHKRQSASGIGFLLALADRLPGRFAVRARALAVAFADGIVWPREHWRGSAIVLSSVVIKLLAASHLFWAGLAFGVSLEPLIYLSLLAILGFVVILAHMARVPAGFVVGAVFALGLFGVGEATALAMVTVVMAASMLAIGIFGSWGLWIHSVGLGDLGRPQVAGNVEP